MERSDYIAQLENVWLEVPVENFEFPWDTFKVFPTYCGAGKGIGDLIVPDRIFGLKVSPACYIHDQDFDMAPPNLLYLLDANRRLFNNLGYINDARSRISFLHKIRRYRIVTYRNAVDTLGVKIFWKLKLKQGHELPVAIIDKYNLRE